MNLKVLYIEDSQPDVELVESLLSEQGIQCDMTVVEVESELKHALEGCTFDLILSDHSFPAYNGIAALSVARMMCPDVPFIFVSGTLGEETAIECVKCGATDYVLKDRLSRLPPVVRRALDETEARKRHEIVLRELEESREAFYQAQKMETVGRLTGGIAHDFNNMLTVVIGFAEVIRSRISGEDPIHGYVGQILEASQRAAELVEQLLSYSRNQRLTPDLVDLNEELESILKMIGKLVTERVTVKTELEEELWTVEIDRVRFAQIAMNLAANARDAMPEGGVLEIKTRNESLTSTASPVDLPRGDYVVVSVGDNGTGMDEETLGKIFEPFFTTKEPGKGTGLGLASSYGIVKQSGGAIVADSVPGQGTKFEVYLPRKVPAMNVLAPTEPQPPEETEIVPHEHILIVDDELPVLNLLQLVLEEAGYTVISATSAAEARTLAADGERRIDLLVTDVVLSDATGSSLAAELVHDRPGTPVLYTSGYAQSVLSEQGLSPDEVTIVPKPIKVQELQKAIRTTLNNNPIPTGTEEGGSYRS